MASSPNGLNSDSIISVPRTVVPPAKNHSGDAARLHGPMATSLPRLMTCSTTT